MDYKIITIVEQESVSVSGPGLAAGIGSTDKVETFLLFLGKLVRCGCTEVYDI